MNGMQIPGTKKIVVDIDEEKVLTNYPPVSHQFHITFFEPDEYNKDLIIESVNEVTSNNLSSEFLQQLGKIIEEEGKGDLRNHGCQILAPRKDTGKNSISETFRQKVNKSMGSEKPNGMQCSKVKKAVIHIGSDKKLPRPETDHIHVYYSYDAENAKIIESVNNIPGNKLNSEFIKQLKWIIEDRGPFN